MVISERVRERLTAKGLSQSELARRVGISQSAVAKLALGTGYGSKHLHRIARELGTTPAYLAGETDDPDSEVPETDLSEDEARMVSILRQLPEAERDALKRVAESMIGPRTLNAPRLSYRHED